MIHAKQVRYTFDETVPLAEARGTLELARLAAESLHGPGRVALEATCRVDRPGRTFTIDTSTEAGRTLALIFGGYAEKEFGSAVRMRRSTADVRMAGEVGRAR